MKAVTFIGNEQSEMAGKFVAVGISVFLAKYGLDSPEDRGVMITYITVRLSGRFLWG